MQPSGDKKPTLLIVLVGLWLTATSCTTMGLQGQAQAPASDEDAVGGLSPVTADATQPSGLGEIKKDPAIEDAIRSQASRLGGAAPPVVAFFYSPADHLQPFYVKPGSAWYFSVQALRGLRFENEFAAAVSAALAVPATGATTEATPSWRAMTRQMVRSLYRAGYDPRGAASFWKAWGILARQGFGSGPRQMAWAALSSELEQEAHGEIAQLPPLLNPVVRTPEFAKIGKRLQKL